MRIAATRRPSAVVALALAAAGLWGCVAAEDPAPVAEAPVTTPDGDVLAPDLYRFAGEAMWDGRPSLGGAWVAHPDVAEPLRVRVRRADGPAVTGALFRRERLGDGPAMQVSSAAAEALGLEPGEPAAVVVTALRPPPVATPSDAAHDG